MGPGRREHLPAPDLGPASAGRRAILLPDGVLRNEGTDQEGFPAGRIRRVHSRRRAGVHQGRPGLLD